MVSNMESRNIILTLDKAKEWYKQGGELKEVALQAFSENELTKIELPKTWEEFCENYPKGEQERTINTCSVSVSSVRGHRDAHTDKNSLPSKEAAEAHLALMQLHQLRDCYRQGWVPDWEDSNRKYVIRHYGASFDINWFAGVNSFLSFQTAELANEFLKNFQDLIEKAGDLI